MTRWGGRSWFPSILPPPPPFLSSVKAHNPGKTLPPHLRCTLIGNGPPACEQQYWQAKWAEHQGCCFLQLGTLAEEISDVEHATGCHMPLLQAMFCIGLLQFNFGRPFSSESQSRIADGYKASQPVCQHASSPENAPAWARIALRLNSKKASPIFPGRDVIDHPSPSTKCLAIFGGLHLFPIVLTPDPILRENRHHKLSCPMSMLSSDSAVSAPSLSQSHLPLGLYNRARSSWKSKLTSAAGLPRQTTRKPQITAATTHLGPVSLPQSQTLKIRDCRAS